MSNQPHEPSYNTRVSLILDWIVIRLEVCRDAAQRALLLHLKRQYEQYVPQWRNTHDEY